MASTWDVVRAREHVQSRSKYSGLEKKWNRSSLQVFLLAEQDFLYYARAFHHVKPASNRLSTDDAALYMAESWRCSPVKEDLGYFECHYCRQYAKHAFCTEVMRTSPLDFMLCPLHNTYHLHLLFPAY
jgi:hypothetical protein